MPLSATHIVDCLARAGITAPELDRLNYRDLLQIPGIGDASAWIIMEERRHRAHMARMVARLSPMHRGLWRSAGRRGGTARWVSPVLATFFAGIRDCFSGTTRNASHRMVSPSDGRLAFA